MLEYTAMRWWYTALSLAGCTGWCRVLLSRCIGVLREGLVLGERLMRSTRTELWVVDASHSGRLEFCVRVDNAHKCKVSCNNEVNRAQELP